MTDFSEEETQQMVDMFGQMGVKPKCDSPADLQNWMMDYLHSVGKLQETPETKAKPNVSSTSRELVVTQQQLRLPNFSGDSSKSEVTYELWRNEVDCLLAERTYSESQILQAARKSLRGEAGGINLRMRTEGTIHDLLAKLEAVYGTVELGETLLSQFYSAQQREDETVATWGCRVEDLLDKARRRGQVSADAMDEMLRTKFWTGLRPDLKASSRHKFDTTKQFDTLRKELRAIEHEQLVYQRQSKPEAAPSSNQTQPNRPKAQVKTVTSNTTTAGPSESSDFQELKGLVLSLQKQVQALQPPTADYSTQGPYKAKGDQPSTANTFQPQQFAPTFQFQAQTTEQPQTQPHPGGQMPAQPYSQGPRPSRFGPCYHCGGGHMKRNCPALQQQAHLNMVAQTLGGECLQHTDPAPAWTNPQMSQASQGSWWGSQQRQTYG